MHVSYGDNVFVWLNDDFMHGGVSVVDVLKVVASNFMLSHFYQKHIS